MLFNKAVLSLKKKNLHEVIIMIILNYTLLIHIYLFFLLLLGKLVTRTVI